MFARRFSLFMAVMLAFALLGVTPVKAEKRSPFVITVIEVLEETLVKDAVVGTNWHGTLRTRVLMTSTDPRYHGVITFDFKCMARLTTPLPGWGPCEGQWSVDADADGMPEWMGTVHIMPQINEQIMTAEYNGHGLNEYAGLQLKMTDVTDMNTGVMVSTGEIFDPKGK